MPELNSVKIFPEKVDLSGNKAAQRFLVTGVFADGLERDITELAHLTVSDAKLAKIDQARLRPLADGNFNLIAEFKGKQAVAKVSIADSQVVRPFSFGRDIGQILTRHGCNATDCHGSVKGANGFKLSVNAGFPKDDYKWIVEGGVYKVLTTEQPGPPKPRINKEKPEDSLFLKKPTEQVSHGGGKRFEIGSDDYQTIVEWIKAGAPYGEESQTKAATYTKLEVSPSEAVLAPSGKQRLLVTGVLPDGHREDLTDKVMFVTSNAEVASVSSDGIVEAAPHTGETAILIRGAGRVVSARIGVIAKPVENYPTVPTRNFIDEHIFAKLRKFNIIPSELSSDEEFLRRVCLDVTGVLPPPHRIQEFVADTDPAKRDKLIEILLASPEYVDLWSYRVGDLFRVYFSAKESQKETSLFNEWVRNSIAQNRPWNLVAQERIACAGYGGLTQNFHHIGDKREPSDVMAEQMRAFEGIRMECAQCHNHPFEAWSQDQFWGLTAFYSRIVPVNGVEIDMPSDINGLTMPSVSHPRTKQEVRPAFLDGRQVPEGSSEAWRMLLAKWMTADDNHYFARATVNRMWGYFFGRGIVDPVDDFRSTNPPTHPELLDALAADFIKSGYDLKHLFRTIVQSRAYQLTSTTNATNGEDQINYSHYVPHPLEPVVLMDAISHATGVPEPYEADKFIGGGPLPLGTRATQLIPDICPSQFMTAYGRSNRVALPEKNSGPTLAQALHMLVGSTYNEKIDKPGGRVARLLKAEAKDPEVIDEFYLASLCRKPTDQEKSALEELLKKGPSRQENIKALAWALISSREFACNH